MKRVCARSLLVVVLMLSKCFGGTGGISTFSFNEQPNPQRGTQQIVEFWANVAFDFNDRQIVVRSRQAEIRHYLEERMENARKILEQVVGLEGEWALSKELIMLNHSSIYSQVQPNLSSCAIARMLYYFPLIVEQNVRERSNRLGVVLPEQEETFKMLLEESRRFARVLLANLQ